MTTARTLLSELRTRGVQLSVEGNALRYRAPRGAVTPQLRRSLKDHKPELVAALQSKVANGAKENFGDLGKDGFSADAGEVAAVKLRGTVVGDVWLLADEAVLVEHPHILRSQLPTFLFAEVEQLQGKTVEELKAIAKVKRVFPTSWLVQ